MKKVLSIESQLVSSLLKKGDELRREQELLSVSALISLLRLGLGMSQRQLAKRANMPHSTISRIEKGTIHPNEDTLRKIFAAMECDLAFIPIPHFKNVEALLRRRAERIAEKRLLYLEGTMALEKQKPEKKWRERLLENEIEELLKTPSLLWDEDDPV
jgi:transcriptional regulator with XRE-family HTH domain